MIESRGSNGKMRHNTLIRLGEASAPRETGERDRIISALQALAERRYVDVDELQFDQAPVIAMMAAV